MSGKSLKTVLFMSPDPGEAARNAASLFAAVAGKMFTLWTPTARTPSTVTEAEHAGAARLILLNLDPAAVPFPPRPDATDITKLNWTEADCHAVIARLLGGTADAPPAKAAVSPAIPVKKSLGTVKVGRETAGRRGKGVTTVWEIPLNEAALKELCTKLKERCGTGGTVKDGRIEIQGDHRDTVAGELEKLGYKVKRAGG